MKLSEVTDNRNDFSGPTVPDHSGTVREGDEVSEEEKEEASDREVHCQRLFRQ